MVVKLLMQFQIVAHPSNFTSYFDCFPKEKTHFLSERECTYILTMIKESCYLFSSRLNGILMAISFIAWLLEDELNNFLTTSRLMNHSNNDISFRTIWSEKRMKQLPGGVSNYTFCLMAKYPLFAVKKGNALIHGYRYSIHHLSLAIIMSNFTTLWTNS